MLHCQSAQWGLSGIPVGVYATSNWDESGMQVAAFNIRLLACD